VGSMVARGTGLRKPSLARSLACLLLLSLKHAHTRAHASTRARSHVHLVEGKTRLGYEDVLAIIYERRDGHFQRARPAAAQHYVIR